MFTRTKHGANRLALQLEKDGIRAAAIHGNKSQAQRVRALDDFKAGRVDLLVATDVAARGIDIEQLPHVINFELPMVAEDYVHRIGRTGRAGVDGQAISLVCIDEQPLLQAIQQLLRRAIPMETIAGFEPDRSQRPQPIRLRSTPAERAETAANRAAHGGGRQGTLGPPAASVTVAGERRRPPGTVAASPAATRRSSRGRAVPRAAAEPSRASGPRRRRSRGGASGAPGTGFGNGAPSGHHAAQPRSGDRRPQGHGGSAHGSGSGTNHGSAHGGHASAARAMPGERIRRLG